LPVYALCDGLLAPQGCRIDERMADNHAESAFAAIVGSRLSSVTFLMDYVQCDFDGATLTAYTLPTVSVGGRSWSRREVGWRDALCERIGSVVHGVVCSDDHLTIDFDDNSRIAVSLRDNDYVGPEAFILSSPNHPIVVG
jgi:hypothetical protein